jgi:hypothetical protein
MASIVRFDPLSIAAKALFNFDDIADSANFKLSGPVSFSVSDAFTKSSYSQFSFSPDVYTSAASGATNWTATQLANIQSTLDTYSQFINLSFSKVNNYLGLNPAQVGERADINLSLINRSNLSFAGLSAIDSAYFGYSGGELDIVLNTSGFGGSDTTLSTSTFGGRALMHEIGHSIGLSHPHLEYVNGKAVLTADFAATTQMGFSKLGFVTNSAQDMNKEYFSIMSYDDQVPNTGGDTYAQTPMILDVLALQEAYGAGVGTSSTANDVITMGASAAVNSFRTYFDAGGVDTVNLANYSSGAYLHLGTTIVGAQHLVGVSMSTADRQLMLSGSSPQSLRWFYGEFENAVGSAANDLITGSALANMITGSGGNDSIDGGAGLDTAVYSGTASNYSIKLSSSNCTITDKTANRDGTDTLSNIERLKFLVADPITGANGVALDISKDQTAGSGYMLYKAAFNRTPDAGGLGFWMSKMDGGMDYNSVAQNFVNSTEFKTAFGGSNPTVNTLVTKLYNNVLTRNPDSVGLAFWQEKLTNGGWTTANVLGYFATSDENVANVTPLIANGISYQEWVG